MDTIFETERLRARPLTNADGEACFALYGDPSVTRYVTPGGATAPNIEWVLAQIDEGLLARQPDRRFGFWGLERRSDDLVVGTVALVEVDDFDGDYEIGWHLAPAHWGQGYALESGIALLRHGFDAAGLDRVLALVHPDNERSLRACVRLGMERSGMRINHGSEHAEFVAEKKTWVAPPRRSVP